jgi:hypothetical protein
VFVDSVIERVDQNVFEQVTKTLFDFFVEELGEDAAMRLSEGRSLQCKELTRIGLLCLGLN